MRNEIDVNFTRITFKLEDSDKNVHFYFDVNTYSLIDIFDKISKNFKKYEKKRKLL